MKTKLAIVFGVLGATVLLVVLMVVSPDQRPAPEPQPVGPKSPQSVAASTPSEPQSSAVEPAAAEPPSPLPTEEEKEAIRERIESAAYRLPIGLRLRFWWYKEKRTMSDEEYENAEGLYLRFLDNFARIQTARFRVEEYAGTNTDSPPLLSVQEIVWTPEKERVEETVYEDGNEAGKVLTIFNGDECSEWIEDALVYRGKVRDQAQESFRYLHRNEMSMVLKPRLGFLNHLSNCEVDDGSRGYSRLWNSKGFEERFETASGMLTQRSYGDGDFETFRYQAVDGLWFPLETVFVMRWEYQKRGEQTRTRRAVFSRVVLNEAVDESLFDVNNPG